MAQSQMRMFKRIAEQRPKDQIDQLPEDTRGIYALLRKGKGKVYDVVYVGLTKDKFRSRLKKHAESKRKTDWTHFSVYEVHDNVTDAEIAEIEGIIRHIYRADSRVNEYNIQRKFTRMSGIRDNKFNKW